MMWIIKMKFVGKDDTYTIQEESATDESWAKIKYQRMLQNWYHILCRDIQVSSEVLCDQQKSDILLKTIQYQISLLNNGSTFEISKEEI
jgi:hypothetical protein